MVTIFIKSNGEDSGEGIIKRHFDNFHQDLFDSSLFHFYSSNDVVMYNKDQFDFDFEVTE